MLSIRSCRKSSPLLVAAIATCLAAASANGVEGSSNNGVEEVVVTGTFIRGGADEGTLPITVLSTDELTKQGSPSMSELIKALPSSQGVMGDANQFGAGYSLGSANINLRGLGSVRTLVLLNGKRIAPNPAIGVGVDVNLMPTAAIGRIEVLKDGAAATYGSDAMAGVVNFITRTDLQGLAVDGAYNYIPDSDGEYNANLAYGWKSDATDMLFAAGYRHRSQLHAQDRDWSLRAYDVNPSGGWTGAGMPATFKAGLTNTGAAIVDPQCQNLGGQPTRTLPGVPAVPGANPPIPAIPAISGYPSTMAQATGCQTQYLALDNLMEDEDHYQLFAQINHRFNDAVTLHAEALYAQHTAIEHSSPSYTPTQGPTGISNAGVNSWYTVPVANPGLSTLMAQLTPTQQTAITNGGGVSLASATWRPFLVGGNPLTGGAKEDKRDNDSYRVSLGLSGNITDHLGWNTSATYSETTNDAHTPDIYVARMQLALSGLGGPNCTGTTPGAGGCEWLNPFSSAVSENIATGQQPSVAGTVPNSADLTKWLFGDFGYHLSQTVLAVDAGLNGELPWQLPGGEIGWAFGIQYRENGYTRNPVDDADVAINPCAQSIINPAATCNLKTGVLSFNSPLSQYDLTQDVKSAYLEFKFPILDNLSAQAAVRYEDYGGGIGATTNPKLAMYWQPWHALAFRGSLGSTFRAPAGTLTPTGLLSTGNAFVAQALHYLPFDTYGNPALKPETAFTYDIGMLVNAGGFTGSVDFWRFQIDDAIVSDSGTQIIAAWFNGTNHCGDPQYAEIQSRLTFNTGVCGTSALDLGRVRLTNTNAQRFDVAGIDAELHYLFADVFGGGLMIGTEGTYNTKFGIGSVSMGGVPLQAGDDYIGTRGSTGGSLPQWKASAFLDYALGVNNFRWTARHVSSMRDIRAVKTVTSYASFTADDPGATVESFTQHDFTYRLSLPSRLTATATVTNVFDKGPSLARLDLSYDPFVGNPIGRVIKIGLSKTFE
jgi:iron complex outermembrane recepter protein